MKEKKLRGGEVVKVTLALFIICIITTALLALVNSVTAKPIAANNLQKMNTAMTAVLPNAVDFEKKETESGSYYEGKDSNGNIVGYAFDTSASGYGGAVEVMTGINADGSINAVAIVAANNETPGLGLKVKNEEFLVQFEGKTVSLMLVTASQKTGADNEIDAVTSATYSSRAVVNAVNEAREIYDSIVGGEQ